MSLRSLSTLDAEYIEIQVILFRFFLQTYRVPGKLKKGNTSHPLAHYTYCSKLVDPSVDHVEVVPNPHQLMCVCILIHVHTACLSNFNDNSLHAGLVLT